MSSKIIFYPVDNGDMTLIKLDDKTTILIDCKIRNTAEQETSDHYDVISDLKQHLQKDSEDRPYVDVFLQTHPDEDHLLGITNHFHLDRPEDYKTEDNKIIIQEIWSSPIVYSRKRELCKEAECFATEARRRVNLYKKNGSADAGNRIKVIGEYNEDKRKNIEGITFNEGDSFNDVNNQAHNLINMNVLGPLPKSEDEEEEALLANNRSSIIIQFEIAGRAGAELNNRFLSCGDAKVDIWERIWERHKSNPQKLNYDILLCPHHCSWLSLSHDQEKKVEHPKQSDDAVRALSQINNHGYIISSSKPIKPDKDNPPSHRAKLVYKRITDSAKGAFICTSEYPNERQPQPIEVNLTVSGTQIEGLSSQASTTVAASSSTSTVRKHG